MFPSTSAVLKMQCSCVPHAPTGVTQCSCVQACLLQLDDCSPASKTARIPGMLHDIHTVNLTGNLTGLTRSQQVQACEHHHDPGASGVKTVLHKTVLALANMYSVVSTL